VTLILKDSLINLPVMTGPQAVERMVELFGKAQLLAALGADCAEAVAAEREACAARLEGLVEKFKSYEYTVERVSYIADLLEAEVAAIRAGPGEGEQGKGRPAFAQDGPMQSLPRRRPICP